MCKFALNVKVATKPIITQPRINPSEKIGLRQLPSWWQPPQGSHTRWSPVQDKQSR